MGSNNDAVNLFHSIKNVQDIEKTVQVAPTLHDMRITPHKATVRVATRIAPTYVLQRDAETSEINQAGKVVWYCLATHNITITMPAPFKTESGRDRSALRLGTIRVRVDHDDEVQKLNDPKYDTKDAAHDGRWGPKTLNVACIHAGPGPSTSSQEVSNSVSQDLGGSVGIFGNMPTAGINASYSISNSISKTIRDVSILHNSTDRNGSEWVFEFAQFDSEASRSDFDYQVQEIWEFETIDGLVLDQMAFNVSVEWAPRGWWVAGNNKLSEGDCAKMAFWSRARILQAQIPQSTGPQAEDETKL